MAFALTLSACGVIQDRSTEYTQAKIGKPLTIPEGLSELKVRSAYLIPNSNSQRELSKSYELPLPPNGTAALESKPYLIESIEGLTWLRLETSPGRLWPLLDLFWAEYGIDIQVEEISQGYVLTEEYDEKVVSRASLKESLDISEISLKGLSFQAKLVQGVRRNTAELQVRVVSKQEPKGIYNQAWLPTSQNEVLEKAMLKLMGEFVTSEDLQNRYSLLANDIGGEARVRLMKDKEGVSFIELDLSFQRAWNELGKALDAAGVLVSDIDLQEKSYFISYLDEDEVNHWYRTSTGSAEKAKERNFTLVLEQSNDKIVVRVRRLNEKMDAEIGIELLNIVFEHIS